MQEIIIKNFRQLLSSIGYRYYILCYLINIIYFINVLVCFLNDVVLVCCYNKFEFILMLLCNLDNLYVLCFIDMSSY